MKRQALIGWVGSKHTHACTVLDLAAGGARITVEPGTNHNHLFGGLEKGVLLAIPIDRVEVLAEVRWREGRQLGLRFKGPFQPTAKRHGESDLGSSMRQWAGGPRVR